MEKTSDQVYGDLLLLLGKPTIVEPEVGAVLGGLAGKGVAEVIDPTAEEAYWRVK